MAENEGNDGGEAIESLSKEQQVLITKELLRKTPEYQVCWELELWKKQQKHIFSQSIKKLKRKELQKLKESFQNKENELQKQFRIRRNKLNKMEARFTTSMQSIEKREQKIKFIEKELRQRKRQVETEHNQKIGELEHQKKIMQESCAHKVGLLTQSLKLKTRELESNSKKVSLLERQNRRLREDLMKVNKSIETSQIVKLQTENDTLKRRYEETLASKNRYKIEWKKSLKSLESTKRKFSKRIQLLIDKIIILQQQQNEKSKLDKSNSPQRMFQAPSSIHPQQQRSENTIHTLDFVSQEISGPIPDEILPLAVKPKVFNDQEKKKKQKEDEEKEKMKESSVFDEVRKQLEEVRKEIRESLISPKREKNIEDHGYSGKREFPDPEKDNNNNSTEDNNNNQKRRNNNNRRSEDDNGGLMNSKSKEDIVSSFEDGDSPQIGSPQRVKVFIKKKNKEEEEDDDDEKKPNEDAKNRENLKKLIRQKALLLNTGNYSEDDDIIRRINEKLENLSNIK